MVLRSSTNERLGILAVRPVLTGMSLFGPQCSNATCLADCEEEVPRFRSSKQVRIVTESCMLTVALLVIRHVDGTYIYAYFKLLHYCLTSGLPLSIVHPKALEMLQIDTRPSVSRLVCSSSNFSRSCQVNIKDRSFTTKSSDRSPRAPSATRKLGVHIHSCGSGQTSSAISSSR